ncbi:hypothetical protein MIND_00291700 [Mycena indigotica]|uniref:DUF6589 domain-containing protein n=1 Tax=Mycena indigotica TaxID=2126181 RepID=A0A8H6WDR3_9AGAR|nr:uncharacterized protein MIND_00291700 [Mycena indigotica]KAF7312766.1 hypothetical protein MIND_00291700 [Mycena indigotica]
MAYAQSIFKQYLGTTKGEGLRKAFSTLKRRGLQTASIKGPFHQSLEEAIYHVTEAHLLVEWKRAGQVSSLRELQRKSPTELKKMATTIVAERASTDALNKLAFEWDDNKAAIDEGLRQTIMYNRDALQYIVLDEAIKNGDVGMMEALLPTLLFRFIGGGNKKYQVEVLELLQGLEREWTLEVKQFIRENCWVINFVGRRNSHVPIDQAQEHNIKDIKVTYRSEGFKINWSYLKKLHPAIPVIRALCEHMEHEFGTDTRGKKHSAPRKDSSAKSFFSGPSGLSS